MDVNNGGIGGCFTFMWGVVIVVGMCDRIGCCGEVHTGFLSPEVNTVMSCCFEVLIQCSYGFEVFSSGASGVLGQFYDGIGYIWTAGDEGVE